MESVEGKLVELGRQRAEAFRAQQNGDAVWRIDGEDAGMVTLSHGAETQRVAVSDFVAANRDTIESILRGEREIIRLPEIRREREVICMTDVHGNMKALEATLLSNGIAERTPDGWVPTAKGMQTVLIIDGDANDRGESFLEIAGTLLQLKQRGMDIRLLWGDHELGLKALTSEPATLSRDDWSKSELQVMQWAGGEAKASLKEMEAWYDAQYPPDQFGITPEEEAWVRAKRYDALFRNPRIRQLVIARRLCTGSGPVARYFDALEGMASQDDVLYLHALPNEYWGTVLNEKDSKEESIAHANRHFRALIDDPRMLHKMAFGEREPIDLDATMIGSADYPPEASIVWDRWRRSGLPEDVTQTLRNKGWSAMVRGHDKQFEGHVAHHANDFTVINADVCLEAQTVTGNARIMRDGRVMGWQRKAKARPQ